MQQQRFPPQHSLYHQPLSCCYWTPDSHSHLLNSTFQVANQRHYKNHKNNWETSIIKDKVRLLSQTCVCICSLYIHGRLLRDVFPTNIWHVYQLAAPKNKDRFCLLLAYPFQTKSNWISSSAWSNHNWRNCLFSLSNITAGTSSTRKTATRKIPHRNPSFSPCSLMARESAAKLLVWGW